MASAAVNPSRHVKTIIHPRCNAAAAIFSSSSTQAKEATYIDSMTAAR
jgi:hypothetical protein